MSLRSFVGPAGSGKTTFLLRALEARLQERPLADDQRVLAITRMHGARHRLEEKLAHGAARGLVDCMTLDRLGWLIATRWRDRAAHRGVAIPTDMDFDETCRVASMLLAEVDLLKWIVRRYPLIVVDEFQDCREGRLGMVQALATGGEVLVAADGFQDLSGELTIPAVDWLESAGEIQSLQQIFRTRKPELLTASNALRAGHPLQKGWNGSFSLVAVKNPNVGASIVARNIHWSASGSLVLLSPAGPSRSVFVRKLMARIAERPVDLPKPRGTTEPRTCPRTTCGPYRIPWERSSGDAEKDLLEALHVPIDLNSTVNSPSFPTNVYLPGRYEVEQWIEHCRRVRGKTHFSVPELQEAVGRAVQHHRAHAHPAGKLRAMTIHQAKNQEFDEAVILWPFEVQGDPERLRRLLYNAVTRAKKKAVVIVQDPSGDRLGMPPFCCPTN